MRRSLVVAILLASIISCAGCTSFWYQEGKTFDECARARQQCISEMKKCSDKNINLGVYDIRFEENCMRQRGYRLVKEKKLPLRVRRQGPGSSRGTHGVAGLLEH